MVASLQMNYIPPCGVVGVKVEWHDDLVNFVDVNLMFDTELEGPDMDKWRSGNLPTKRECCHCCDTGQRPRQFDPLGQVDPLGGNNLVFLDCTGCDRGKYESNSCSVS